jgi:hypothetical protein
MIKCKYYALLDTENRDGLRTAIEDRIGISISLYFIRDLPSDERFIDLFSFICATFGIQRVYFDINSTPSFITLVDPTEEYPVIIQDGRKQAEYRALYYNIQDSATNIISTFGRKYPECKTLPSASQIDVPCSLWDTTARRDSRLNYDKIRSMHGYTIILDFLDRFIALTQRNVGIYIEYKEKRDAIYLSHEINDEAMYSMIKNILRSIYRYIIVITTVISGVTIDDVQTAMSIILTSLKEAITAFKRHQELSDEVYAMFLSTDDARTPEFATVAELASHISSLLQFGIHFMTTKPGDIDSIRDNLIYLIETEVTPRNTVEYISRLSGLIRSAQPVSRTSSSSSSSAAVATPRSTTSLAGSVFSSSSSSAAAAAAAPSSAAPLAGSVFSSPKTVASPSSAALAPKSSAPPSASVARVKGTVASPSLAPADAPRSATSLAGTVASSSSSAAVDARRSSAPPSRTVASSSSAAAAAAAAGGGGGGVTIRSGGPRALPLTDGGCVVQIISSAEDFRAFNERLAKDMEHIEHFGFINHPLVSLIGSLCLGSDHATA